MAIATLPPRSTGVSRNMSSTVGRRALKSDHSRYILRTGPQPIILAPKNPRALKAPTRRKKFREKSLIKRITLGILFILGMVMGLTLFGSPIAASPTIASASAGLGDIPIVGNFLNAAVPDVNICTFIPGLVNGETDVSKINAPFPTRAYPGMLGLPGFTIPTANSGLKPTGFEMFGTALGWDAYPYGYLGASCGISAVVGNVGTIILNMGFQLFSLAVQVMMWIFSAAMDWNLLIPFINIIGGILEATKTALYLNYLIPIVLASAVWIGWQGLVKKRSSEAVQGVAWMVAAASFTTIFLTSPTVYIRGLNSIVSTITQEVMLALPSVTGKAIAESKNGRGVQQTNDGFSLCDTGSDGSLNFAQDNMSRSMQCQIWQTFFFTPWAYGQFGNMYTQQIRSGDGMKWPNGPNNKSLPVVYLGATTVTSAQIAVEMGSGAGGTSGSWGSKSFDMTERDRMWREVLVTMSCPAGSPKTTINGKETTVCENSVSWGSFTGVGWADKMGILTLAIVALLFGAIPLIFLAVTLIFLTFSAIFLYLTAPVYLTLGIHPGFGRRIAMGWIEQIIANSLKRIATGFLIGALLVVLEVAMTINTTGWLQSAFIISVASFAVLKYRKKFLDQVGRVNLGGSGGGGSSAEGADRMGKKVMGKTIGAGAQAAGKAASGGSAMEILSAGAVGAFMGRASAPGAAATGAYARGVGGRKGKKGQEEKPESAIDQGKRERARDKDANVTMRDLAERMEDAIAKGDDKAKEAVVERIGRVGKEIAGAGGAIPVSADRFGQLVRETLKDVKDNNGNPIEFRDMPSRSGPPRPDRRSDPVADLAAEIRKQGKPAVPGPAASNDPGPPA